MSQTALGEFATVKTEPEPEVIEKPPVVRSAPEPEPSPTSYECQGCGSIVSADYMRVMCPPGAPGPEKCPHCNREGKR